VLDEVERSMPAEMSRGEREMVDQPRLRCKVVSGVVRIWRRLVRRVWVSFLESAGGWLVGWFWMQRRGEGGPSNLCSRSMGLSLFRQYATAYTIGPRTGPRPASSTPRITSPLGSSWMDLGIGEW